MDKKKLLILPFSVGLVLMVYSWYVSYPLSVDSVDDLIFNHLSILYWFSLPLLLASMCLIAVTFENRVLKWIMTVGIVMAMYSTSYFYYRLPTSDSVFYRGLNEYFTKTRNLDFSQPGKSFFQWPAVFVLTDIATSVSGLELANFEFLMYAIIGFLLTTTLYLYASKAYKKGGFIAVVAFFIAMFSYLNYQFAAFTIAFSLLLLLLTLDTRRWTFSMTLTMLVLFTSMTLTHPYVPVFFLIFLLIRSIISRSKQHGMLFLLTSTIYLLYQITSANVAFASYIWYFIRNESSEISYMVKVIPVSIPIDAIAQKFTIAMLITTVTICAAGFIILLIKRKMRDLDKAIFLTGLGYFGVGIVVFIAGSRAFAIAFIPISLGASYLFESRLKPHLKGLFLVLLILFVFVPLHASYTSFSNTYVPFQTKEASNAEHFIMDHYNWTKPSLILAHAPVTVYLLSSLDTKQISATFESDFSSLFPRLIEYNCILYTVGLGNSFLKYNYTLQKIVYEEQLNVVYNNGFSDIIVKNSNFASALP